MKTVLYYILGVVIALLNNGCQTVGVRGNGNRVVTIKIDGENRNQAGRGVNYGQPVAMSGSGQCGGGEIITIRNHQNGQVVWSGQESQMPLALRAGWQQHRGQARSPSFSGDCNQPPFGAGGYQQGYQQSGYSGRRGGQAGPGILSGMIGGHKVYDSQYPNGAWVP